MVLMSMSQLKYTTLLQKNDQRQVWKVELGQLPGVVKEDSNVQFKTAQVEHLKTLRKFKESPFFMDARVLSYQKSQSIKVLEEFCDFTLHSYLKSQPLSPELPEHVLAMLLIAYQTIRKAKLHLRTVTIDKIFLKKSRTLELRLSDISTAYSPDPLVGFTAPEIAKSGLTLLGSKHKEQTKFDNFEIYSIGMVYLLTRLVCSRKFKIADVADFGDHCLQLEKDKQVHDFIKNMICEQRFNWDALMSCSYSQKVIKLHNDRYLAAWPKCHDSHVTRKRIERLTVLQPSNSVSKVQSHVQHYDRGMVCSLVYLGVHIYRQLSALNLLHSKEAACEIYDLLITAVYSVESKPFFKPLQFGVVKKVLNLVVFKEHESNIRRCYVRHLVRFCLLLAELATKFNSELIQCEAAVIINSILVFVGGVSSRLYTAEQLRADLLVKGRFFMQSYQHYESRIEALKQIYL